MVREQRLAQRRKPIRVVNKPSMAFVSTYVASVPEGGVLYQCMFPRNGVLRDIGVFVEKAELGENERVRTYFTIRRGGSIAGSSLDIKEGMNSSGDEIPVGKWSRFVVSIPGEKAASLSGIFITMSYEIHHA